MDLTSQINRILTDYVDDVDNVVLKVEEEVAKEAVKKLKTTSPVNPSYHGRHYKDGWTVDNKSKKTYAKYIIKNRQYQLTHLLENGHDVVRGGRKVGRAKAQPHIKPVEEWVKTEVEERIRRGLS